MAGVETQVGAVMGEHHADDGAAGDRRFGALALWVPTLFLGIGLFGPLAVAACDLPKLNRSALGDQAAVLRAVLLRTTAFAAAAALVATAGGWVVALALEQFPPRVRRAMLVLSLLPIVFHFVLRTFGLHVLLGPGGVVNSALVQAELVREPLPLTYSAWGTMLALVSWLLSVSVFYMYLAARHVPRDLVDAAASLGAGPVATLRAVWLPLTAPAAVMLYAINFALGYGTYMSPELLGGLEDITVVRLIAQLLREGRSPEAVAFATLATAFPVALFVLLGRIRRALARRGE
jgi:ABC-type spermidine/putrescine transport system permease subunit I